MCLLYLNWNLMEWVIVGVDAVVGEGEWLKYSVMIDDVDDDDDLLLLLVLLLLLL